MSYTNGPWTVEEPILHQLWIVEANKDPHEWRDIAIICEGDEYGWPAEVAQANARLIAAAPDLLAALEDIYAMARIQSSGYARAISLRAQQDIAKARGNAE